MKIEKINDNQIKFTLTKEDLDARNIRMSELAYGSDKAKEFFQDMMREAYDKCGFEAENIPLMIEAIPDPNGSLVLMVTKVDNPDEFDSHFANLSRDPNGGSYDYSEGALDKLLQSIRGISPAMQNALGNRAAAGLTDSLPGQAGAQPSAEPDKERMKEMEAFRNYIMTNRLYSFSSMSEAINAASAASGKFTGESSLIYDKKNHLYYLALKMADIEQVSKMQRTLACFTEYGHFEPITYARTQHLAEHGTTIIKTDAVGKLAAVR